MARTSSSSLPLSSKVILQKLPPRVRRQEREPLLRPALARATLSSRAARGPWRWLQVLARLEEVVARCSYMDWKHFDAGVVKVGGRFSSASSASRNLAGGARLRACGSEHSWLQAGRRASVASGGVCCACCVLPPAGDGPAVGAERGGRLGGAPAAGGDRCAAAFGSLAPRARRGAGAVCACGARLEPRSAALEQVPRRARAILTRKAAAWCLRAAADCAEAQGRTADLHTAVLNACLRAAADLSNVEYMPAYLNKRLNNRLWSRRKAQQQLQPLGPH